MILWKNFVNGHLLVSFHLCCTDTYLIAPLQRLTLLYGCFIVNRLTAFDCENISNYCYNILLQ